MILQTKVKNRVRYQKGFSLNLKVFMCYSLLYVSILGISFNFPKIWINVNLFSQLPVYHLYFLRMHKIIVSWSLLARILRQYLLYIHDFSFIGAQLCCTLAVFHQLPYTSHIIEFTIRHKHCFVYTTQYDICSCKYHCIRQYVGLISAVYKMSTFNVCVPSIS